MKEIVLIRHAKSSWKFNLNDIDRPLKKSGTIDADLVSGHFKTHKPNPDAVFSSPAKRALMTCEIFIKNLEINEDLLVIAECLYDFGGENVMNFVKKMSNDYEKVIIFGHNHAFTSIVNSLGDQYIDNLPTCGLVSIIFNIESWKDINKGSTEYMIFPKNLRD
jgi:phosphohistidine phosphatase